VDASLSRIILDYRVDPNASVIIAKFFFSRAMTFLLAILHCYILFYNKSCPTSENQRTLGLCRDLLLSAYGPTVMMLQS